ncbi:FAR-17a/AIG1-like protein [Geopyxis carbonaria]|nr:FAR-17a/AIG1-like protein [Geopyxis carbonaria]
MDSRLLHRHPLQRLNAPSRSVSALCHFVGLLSFSYSFWYLENFPNEMSVAYGWHFQFLTIIGLALATLTFGFGLLADIFLSPQLFLIKNACAVTSAPLEVLISVLYWGICSIDKTLVMPPEMQLELHADIGFHLLPAVFLFIDIMLLSPPWTFSVLPALAIPATLATGYWFWLEECFQHNGFYPYPLLNQTATHERLFIFCASALTMTGSTLALKSVYGRLNGNLTGGGRAVPGNVQGKKNI